ncbi:MAG: glycosyltransferase family 1 protein [Lachnospiraceae bacterium]|nr:glycosyltransferase family 1 protein [Lachnospiraceae bacterium]
MNTEPIRILHVVGKMHYGGMETLIMNIYRNINREKVQFDFLVHYSEKGEYDDEIRQLGGKIYIMPRTKISNYFKYKKALKYFFAKHNEFIVVHSHLHNLAFMHLSIARHYGMATIEHFHNNSVDRNFKGIIGYYCSRLGIKYADYLFACSDGAAKFFLQGKYKKLPYTIIKNGIETEKFSYNEKIRKQMREQYHCNNQFVVLHVGRFWEQKNHKFLLEIFKEILKQNTNSKLFLIGIGPLEDEIKKKVKNLDIEKNVCFLGVKDNVNEWMQMADCFLFPSLYEGLGIVLIEAQTSGLRCFTSLDKVPVDAKVSENIEYISLKESAKVWADKVLASSLYERKSCVEEVKRAGYDIRETAKWLEEWYCQKAGRKEGEGVI